MDYDKLHTEVSLPCVRIRSGKAWGSGTVICSIADGDEHSSYVLTNHHVIADLIEVKEQWDPMLQRNAKRDIRGIAEAQFFRYRWASRAIGNQGIEADIAAYDERQDLALLHLRSTEAVPAVAKLYPRGMELNLRVGMPVYAVGAGLAQPPVMTSGFLSQFGIEIEHEEFWLNTAPAIYGNSGGALFLAETQEFIGVPARIAVSGYLGMDAITHLQFAIPVTRVYEFLEDQCFRFVYDASFTEDGEEATRKRKREEDKMRVRAEEEQKGST